MAMLTFDGDFDGFFGAEGLHKSVGSDLGRSEYCLCGTCPYTSGEWVCDFCKLEIENKALKQKIAKLEEQIHGRNRGNGQFGKDNPSTKSPGTLSTSP